MVFRVCQFAVWTLQPERDCISGLIPYADQKASLHIRAEPHEASHADSDAEPSRTASHIQHANTGTLSPPAADASVRVQRGEMHEYNLLRIRRRRVVSNGVVLNQRYAEASRCSTHLTGMGKLVFTKLCRF